VRKVAKSATDLRAFAEKLSKASATARGEEGDMTPLCGCQSWDCRRTSSESGCKSSVRVRLAISDNRRSVGTKIDVFSPNIATYPGNSAVVSIAGGSANMILLTDWFCKFSSNFPHAASISSADFLAGLILTMTPSFKEEVRTLGAKKS
jgi:hypothetical protein